MVGGAVAAARRLALDVVSLAPRIVAPGAGARWLQPAFLATLVYRFGPPGVDPPDPERAMANGQCLLSRRDLLERAGGYVVAARSYCDDISIVRQRAASGAHVGFAVGLFDGRRGWGLVLVAANAALVIVRMLFAAATAHSFARRGLAYWLSPLADAPAVLRVVETMTHPPREWRGEPRPVAAAS